MKFNFEEQLTSCMPFLNDYAKKFALEEDDRFDLVSDTLLKAIEKKEYFHDGEGCNFKGWLITVMTNIFINNYRKMVRDATDCYDNEQMALLSEQKYYSRNADSDSICEELANLVKSSLSVFDYRVLMAFANGYAYEQISEIMEIPVGTVKSKIFIARKKIINNIKNNGL